MARVQSTVEILIRAQAEGEAQVRRMAQGLEGLEKSAQKASGAMRALSMAGNLVASFLAGYTLQQVWEFAKGLYETGIQAQRAEIALQAYAGSSWEAEAAIRAVQEATDGAVDRMTAAQMAARLMAMNLAKNAEEAGRLARVAVMLGTSMGRDVQTAFEDFTLMLANASIPRLDTFGISAAKVRERIRELQEEMPGLDRQTAFVTATLEIAEEKLAALEKQGYKTATSVERLKARMQDWWTTAATRFADAVEGFIGGTEAIRSAARQAHDEIIRSAGSYDEYLRMSWEWRRQLPAIAQAVASDIIRPVSEAEWQMRRMMLTAPELTDGWLVAMKDMAQGTEDAMDRIAMSVDEVKQSFADLRLFVAGPLREEEERHEERMARLEKKAADLRDRITELESRRYLTRRQRQELEELRQRYDEVIAKIEEEKERHDEATKRIIFNLLQQRAAMDGLTETELAALVDIASKWGLIDQKTAQAAISIDQALAALAEDEDIDAFREKLDQILQRLETIPEEIDVTVNVQSNWTGAIPGVQGGSVGGGGSKEPRQHGGPVMPGFAYVVGERGPEIFMPRVPGFIYPSLTVPMLERPARPERAAEPSINATFIFQGVRGEVAPQAMLNVLRQAQFLGILERV